MRNSVTCGLCLQGEAVVFMHGAAIHRYGVNGYAEPMDDSLLIVCADSDSFPVGIEIAPKVASA